MKTYLNAKLRKIDLGVNLVIPIFKKKCKKQRIPLK